MDSSLEVLRKDAGEVEARDPRSVPGPGQAGYLS